MSMPNRKEPIAIVGIGCRFPGGVDDVESYWNLMTNGIDAIVDVPKDRWDLRRFYDPDPKSPGKMYTRQGGFITHPIWAIDAQFFGIAPREAAILDPQQRLLLETSWEALEDAGIVPGDNRGTRTGVYIGAFCFDNAFQQAGIPSRNAIGPQTATSGSMVMLSNRISHALDLRGPSLTVDTACSASLVAVHLACQALLNDESDLAIAGGVNVMLRPEAAILECKGGFLSPGSRCRAFDEQADGYVRGEGAGIVVLKKYSAALANDDRIYALIAATGVNQDGRTKGVTVPNRQSQQDLIAEVCRHADIKPSQISFVEAHGTGTQVGDPVEVAALGNVLAEGRNGGSKVWLGSVKTNIGHLEAAAGVAGLIKVALSLKKRQVPPNLHFKRSNPKLKLETLCLDVPTSLVNLADQGPLWAAINSFGYGGTNAHAVLRSVEEPQRRPDQGSAKAAVVFPLSARSPAALKELARRIAERTQSCESVALKDLCFTTSRRRAHHPYRLAVVTDSLSDLSGRLDRFAKDQSLSGVVIGRVGSESARKLVLVYTGMGAPWWGMGIGLATRNEAFRLALEECNEAFVAQGGPSILDIFDRKWLTSSAAAESLGQPMLEPNLAQPANFALQVALTSLWRSLGIEADAVIGHSVGEVAAAWASGVLSLDEAARLTLHRGRLQQTLSGKGTMLAVGLSNEMVLPLLTQRRDGVSIGAVNGPMSVVLTGDIDALSTLSRTFEEQQIFHRFLNVACAYHSAQMDEIENEFRSVLTGLTGRTPRIPLYSSVTGQQIRNGEISSDYWWQNVREPVLFSAALRALEADEYDAFLEVGPHPTLAPSIVATSTRPSSIPTTIASLKRGQDGWTSILEALAALYTSGSRIDWSRVHPQGSLVTLPNYPWQRDVLWTETKAMRADRLVEEIHPLLHQRLDGPVPTWETELNSQFTPYLQDHQLWGAPVCPAAAYAVAGLAVAASTSDGDTVESLAFRTPLGLEQSALLRLQLDERDGYLTIDAHGLEPESGWSTHATARIPGGTSFSKNDQLDLKDLQRRFQQAIAPEKIYATLAELGINDGPSFRVIEQAWRDDQEVFGRLVCHDSVRDDCERYQLHPTLLDGAFQLLVATTELIDVDMTIVPTQIDRVTCTGKVGSSCWAYGKNIKRTANALIGDLLLCNDAGEVLVQVKGLRCQVIMRDASGFRARSKDCWYGVDWINEEAPTRSTVKPGRWLVFADRNGAETGLKSAMNVADADWLIVRRADQFEVVDGVYHVNPKSKSDFEKLFDCITPQAPICGIVYLWGLDDKLENSATEPAEPSTEDTMAFLYLVQALPKSGPEPPKLCLVTHSLYAIDKDLPNFEQASIWGLGRVVANERRDFVVLRVDVETEPGPSTITSLANELLCESQEDEIAFRSGRRFVPRVKRLESTETVTEVSASEEPFRLAIDTPGILDTLRYHPLKRRAPGPDEVEIEVESASVNFKDLMKAMRLLPPAYMEKTFTGSSLGIESSGRVIKVGENVTDLKVGDEIVVIENNGSFSSHNTVSTAFLTHKPLSFDESPCLINFVTPYYAFCYVGRLQKGESVLIHCASGGVGLAAVQIARWLGAKVYATAGSEEKRSYLRGLGIEHVMDSRSVRFAEEISQLTNNRGVDAVLNCLPGEGLRKSIEILAPFGRFLEIGKRDIAESLNLGLAPFDRNLSFSAIDTDRMGLERPALFRRLIDEVCQLLRDGTLHALPVVAFPAAQAVEAFRYMARGKHIGKIVIQMSNGRVPLHRAQAGSQRLDPDATYLITGGLGGVGMLAAKWMVRKGARHLVIASRSGAVSPERKEHIEQLKQQGVDVYLEQIDCSDRPSVAQLFEKMKRELPALRGILHAAMVLDDMPLTRLDLNSFDGVWRSKAVSAWNLHEQSRNLKLDFFMLCSSVAALIGNAGQASYVAANTFLDALACYRRACGLTAVSIAWGVIKAGVIARNPALLDRFQRAGIQAFTPSEFIALLDLVIEQDRAYTVLADIDWPRWSTAQPLLARRPRFSGVSVQDGAHTPADHPRLKQILESPPNQRQKLMESFLCEDISRVIHLPAAKIDVQLTFENLGLDSLMMVELTTTLNMFWGISFSSLQNMQGSTIAQVASDLILLVLRKVSDQPPTVSEDDVDALAEDELDALILAMAEPLRGDETSRLETV
jgi:acyl transferase domain-containing protein/NADPH:quinone reductase-like Zn-dependent oxidoreductase/acyl carrier protein